MKRDWSLFVNPFEVRTQKDYPKAIAIGTQHQNSLFGDSTTNPIFLACYNLIFPVLANLNTAYIQFKAQSGGKKSEVGSFNTLLKQLPAQADDWESKIKVVYPATTSKFLQFFPNQKTPFYRGTQQARVDAVKTLITAIGTDASLAAVKAEIQTFYTSLNSAFKSKNNSKETTKNDSSAVDAARIAMCNVMLANYGTLINLYNTEPMKASKYFDEENLRAETQTKFKGTVKPNKSKSVFKRTFDVAQELEIDNTGQGKLFVALLESPTTPLGKKFVEIDAGIKNIYPITDFGDPTTQTYLVVFNTDPFLKGTYIVKIL